MQQDLHQMPVVIGTIGCYSPPLKPCRSKMSVLHTSSEFCPNASMQILHWSTSASAQGNSSTSESILMPYNKNSVVSRAEVLQEGASERHFACSYIFPFFPDDDFQTTVDIYFIDNTILVRHCGNRKQMSRFTWEVQDEKSAAFERSICRHPAQCASSEQASYVVKTRRAKYQTSRCRQFIVIMLSLALCLLFFLFAYTF